MKTESALLRVVIIKSGGLDAVLSEVIALAIFGVVVMGVASLRFRKRLDLSIVTPNTLCIGRFAL